MCPPGEYTLSAWVKASHDFEREDTETYSFFVAYFGSHLKTGNLLHSFGEKGVWHFESASLTATEPFSNLTWIVGDPIVNSYGTLWATKLQVTDPYGNRLLREGDFPGGRDMPSHVSTSGDVDILPSCSYNKLAINYDPLNLYETWANTCTGSGTCEKGTLPSPVGTQLWPVWRRSTGVCSASGGPPQAPALSFPPWSCCDGLLSGPGCSAVDTRRVPGAVGPGETAPRTLLALSGA